MNDTDKLSAQIDRCADNLPTLMHLTQLQISAAVTAGELDTAKTLRVRMREINFALGAILDRQIAEIDSSADMKKAIAGFTGVNKSITTQMNRLKDLQKFVTTLNSLLGNLNTAVGIALKTSKGETSDNS